MFERAELRAESNLYGERIEIPEAPMRAKLPGIPLAETAIRGAERDLIAKTSDLADLTAGAIAAIELHAKLSVIPLAEAAARGAE